MIKRILVANRGEIAVRVMRSCREMEITSIAIFSEADRTAKHVLYADEAYCVGPAASKESYLNIEKIIEVAKANHADAIHPGYGFLSENAAFARRCQEEGIIFIGPNPETMEAMGDKISARIKMIEAGVPVVPGTQENLKSVEEAVELCNKIGYPVMLKASMGGGGKGMRVGGHIILGLPGETSDAMVAQAGILSDLPLSTLKIHQLQLIRGTRMAHEYDINPADFHLFTEVNEYIDLVIDYVEHLRPDMVVERFVSQSPKDLLIAPDWGLKNYEFVARLQKRMKERGAYQGKKYRDSEKRIIFAGDKFATE